MLVTGKEGLDNGDDAQQNEVIQLFPDQRVRRKQREPTVWFGSQRVAGSRVGRDMGQGKHVCFSAPSLLIVLASAFA
jgi:phage gp46-like protein